MYELNDLFKRYINNECTQEEIKFLLRSFEISDSEAELKEAILKHLESQHQSEELTNVDERIIHVYATIKNKIGADEQVETRVPIVKWSRIISTAAAVFIITAGCYFFMFSDKRDASPQILAVQKSAVIEPGGNKAILTLADGTKVVLDQAANGFIPGTANSIRKTSDGSIEIAEDGSKLNEAELMTLQTPRGGQHQLTLPDGTKIWLNSASSISFPSSFEDGERKVEITGEVYFEVARHKDQIGGAQKFVPFLVKIASKGDKYGQEIKVLGTHFNVNTYSDEGDYKTTLLEGSVRVSSISPSGIPLESKLLSPGQQARLSRNIQVSNVDVQQQVAWKEGLISFVDADIKSIMRQVSRWYDVDVEYSAGLSKRMFTGKIPRSSNLDQLLEILEKSDIHFRIKDRKITVLP